MNECMNTEGDHRQGSLSPQWVSFTSPLDTGPPFLPGHLSHVKVYHLQMSHQRKHHRPINVLCECLLHLLILEQCNQLSHSKLAIKENTTTELKVKNSILRKLCFAVLNYYKT